MALQKEVICPVQLVRPLNKSSLVPFKWGCKKYLTRLLMGKNNCFNSKKNASYLFIYLIARCCWHDKKNAICFNVKELVTLQRLFSRGWLTWVKCILPVTLARHVYKPSSTADPRLCVCGGSYPWEWSAHTSLVGHFSLFTIWPMNRFWSIIVGEINTKWPFGVVLALCL